LPGADLGLSSEDPTIAELLKEQGYATAQFGKNHLGDKDEFLPTNHGFDEFYGNLYHLNAEEEPELPDYPNPEEFPNFARLFHHWGGVSLSQAGLRSGCHRHWGRSHCRYRRFPVGLPHPGY
jgi:arylsulfatase A-like enzyme